MRITMLGTHRGCNDGWLTRQFVKGRVYDTESEKADRISHDLACGFLQRGLARKAEEPRSDLFNQVVDIVKAYDSLLRIPTNPATYAAKGEDL